MIKRHKKPKPLSKTKATSRPTYKSTIVWILWLFALVVTGVPLFIWLRQVPPQMISTSGTCKTIGFRFVGDGWIRTTAASLTAYGLDGTVENATNARLDGSVISEPKLIKLEQLKEKTLPSSLQIIPSGHLGVLVAAIKAHAVLSTGSTNKEATEVEIESDGLGVMVEAQTFNMIGSRYAFANKDDAQFSLLTNSNGLTRVTLLGAHENLATWIPKKSHLDVSFSQQTRVTADFDDCKHLHIYSGNNDIIGAGVPSAIVELETWPTEHNTVWSGGGFALNIVGTATSVSVFEKSILKNNAELIKDESIFRQGIIGLTSLGVICLAKEILERIGKKLAEKLVPSTEEFE